MEEKKLGKAGVCTALLCAVGLTMAMWLSWKPAAAGASAPPEAGVTYVNGFKFYTNDAGETYGSVQQTLDENGSIINIEPDWQECGTTGGKSGYSRSSELVVPEAANPEEALSEKFSGIHVKEVEVHAEPSDDSEVIGVIRLYYGTGSHGLDAGETETQ